MKESSNNSPKISVIVPVYNSEQYLPKCIDSILSQTFTDFELILVNDGSKDGSGDICAQYAQKDNRVRVFHKENGGVSSARNLGLREARGEWITFIDSDDWIEKNSLEEMFSFSNQAEFVIQTGLHYDYPDKTIIKNSKYSKAFYKDAGVLDVLIENNYFSTSDGGACSKLFKNEIIKSNNILFQIKNSAYEDTIFTIEYISKVHSVYICNDSHYHYNHVENSTSLSRQTHNYKEFFQTGSKGFSILNDMNEQKRVDKEDLAYILGVNKFLNMVNYSVFTLYPFYEKVERTVRIDHLVSLFKMNKEYRRIYKYNNAKASLVHFILLLKNHLLADLILKNIFKIKN